MAVCGAERGHPGIVLCFRSCGPSPSACRASSSPSREPPNSRRRASSAAPVVSATVKQTVSVPNRNRERGTVLSQKKRRNRDRVSRVLRRTRRNRLDSFFSRRSHLVILRPLPAILPAALRRRMYQVSAQWLSLSKRPTRLQTIIPTMHQLMTATTTTTMARPGRSACAASGRFVLFFCFFFLFFFFSPLAPAPKSACGDAVRRVFALCASCSNANPDKQPPLQNASARPARLALSISLLGPNPGD